MENAISEAVSAIESGDKKRAHSLLLGVIQEDPNNVLAWLWMAEVYADPKNKKDCYLRALQIDPENEVALAHMKAIKYQEALEKIESEYQDAGKAEADTDEKLSQERQKKSKKKTSPVIALMLVLALALSLAVAYIVLDKRGTFDKWGAKDSEETLLVNQDATSTSPSLGIIAPESTQQSEVSTPESLEKEPETQEPSVDVVEDTPTTTQTAPLFIIEDTPTPTREPSVFVPTNPVPDPMNLVQNGYFLEDFDGWERELKDEGGSSKAAIEDSTNSPFNRMLSISQEGKGFVAFSQNIPISNPDLEFSCKVYTKATEGNIPFFSGSGYSIIVLSYRDHNNEQIGFTRYLNVNESLFAGTAFVGAPDAISDTNTVHNIRVSSGEQVDIYLKVKDEINSNLLGIDIGDVKYISIVIIAGSQDEGAKGIVRISDIVLKER